MHRVCREGFFLKTKPKMFSYMCQIFLMQNFRLFLAIWREFWAKIVRHTPILKSCYPTMSLRKLGTPPNYDFLYIWYTFDKINTPISKYSYPENLMGGWILLDLLFSICEVKTENLEGRNVFHCMSEYQSEHIIVDLNRLSWFICWIRLFPNRECRDLTLQRSGFISRNFLNLQ